MELLSPNEYEFLKNPETFNRNHQYVLIHRIRKKVAVMERHLNFIDEHFKALFKKHELRKYELELLKLQQRKKELAQKSKRRSEKRYAQTHKQKQMKLINK